MNIIQVVRLQEQVYNQIENYQIYQDKVRIFHKEDYLKTIIGKASIKMFKIQWQYNLWDLNCLYQSLGLEIKNLK